MKQLIQIREGNGMMLAEDAVLFIGKGTNSVVFVRSVITWNKIAIVATHNRG